MEVQFIIKKDKKPEYAIIVFLCYMKQPEKKRKKTGEYKPVNNCTLCKRITKNI